MTFLWYFADLVELYDRNYDKKRKLQEDHNNIDVSEKQKAKKIKENHNFHFESSILYKLS